MKKSKLSLSLRDFHACLEPASSSEQKQSSSEGGNAWSTKKDWKKSSDDLRETDASFLGCIELYGRDIVDIVLADCGGDKQAALDVLNMQTDLASPQASCYVQTKAPEASSMDQELPLILSTQSDELRSEGDDWIQVKLRKRCERSRSDARCHDEASSRQALELSQMFYVARRAYFKKASMAWSCGNRKTAGELSAKGKHYANLARERHLEFLDYELISFAQRRGSEVFSLDFHHLFEFEALTLLEFVMTVLLSMDRASTLVVVTGRGNRSLATNGRGVLLGVVCERLDSLAFAYKIEGCGGSVKCNLRI